MAGIGRRNAPSNIVPPAGERAIRRETVVRVVNPRLTNGDVEAVLLKGAEESHLDVKVILIKGVVDHAGRPTKHLPSARPIRPSSCHGIR